MLSVSYTEPIMFKSAIVYRIAPGFELPAQPLLEATLKQMRFTECGPTQTESAGWLEPRGIDHGAMIEKVGSQRIFKLCVQTKAVPTSAVNAELEKRLKKIEEETGHKPRGKAKKELKELIVHEMLPRAFAKTGTTMLWLDAENRTLVVGAGSIKKADRITTALLETIVAAGGSMSLALLNTNMSPVAGMSHWLRTQEAPYQFSVDRECELKGDDGEKSTVRYSRHNLEIDEVVQHIEQGKTPTKLAMTFDERVSFILGADMSLKKIELLEVALESKGQAKGDEAFDADVVLITSELQKVIPALINALDGELEAGSAGEGEESSASPSADAPMKGLQLEVVVAGRTMWQGSADSLMAGAAALSEA